MEQERREEEQRAAGRLQHASEIRSQVRERQQRQVQERVDTFEEGRRLQEEAQRRSQHIADIKRQKLEELRYIWSTWGPGGMGQPLTQSLTHPVSSQSHGPP